jgi:hypothetical protein
MLHELEDYDWQYAFACAGEPDTGAFAGNIDIRGALPTGKYKVETFTREDVVKIYGKSEGEGDESEWIIYGKLKDGRFFAIEAGCDYTGWDCQASGVATIGKTKKEIERFGLSESARQRLRIQLSNSEVD